MLDQSKRKYYRGVVLQKVTQYFNESKKKWYMIRVWKNEYAHNWMKKYYFGDRSTTIIEDKDFDEIMKKIRVDFSRYVWIPKHGEEDTPPICDN